MPVSPAQAEHLAAGVVAHYQDAEAALTARIARNLAKGIDAPEWAATKLAQMQEYERQARRLLADLEKKAATGIGTAITSAYEQGGLSAVADIAKLKPADDSLATLDARIATLEADRQSRLKLGVNTTYEDTALVRLREQRIGIARVVGEPVAVVEPLAGLRAVEALTQETLGNVVATHRGILRSVMDTYRSVIAESSSGVLLGDQTRRQAAQAALNRFAAAGIKGFTDKAGRGWRLESYSEMALRTGCGRAAVQGHTDRLQANGFDLVIVSDAPKECNLCRPFEGHVFSLSGTNPKYPSLESARAAGLYHVNCRHSHSLFQPGVTRPMGDVADPQGYADSQRLRELERRVRAAKRVEQAAMDSPARTLAAGKVRMRQAAIREHVAKTGAKRLPYREQIGKAI